MEFVGQKRQQELLKYSIVGSFAAAVVSGYVSYSVRTGWYTYLAGLLVTWLINVVEWDYFFCEPTSWTEGKYLDSAGFWDLELRERQAQQSAPKQRAQITMTGGPARMTISSKAMPEPMYKKW